MATLIDTLKSKKAALELARAEVKLLEGQVSKITEILSASFEESAFERLQKEAISPKPISDNGVREAFSLASSPSATDGRDSGAASSEKPRNKKGSITETALAAVSSTNPTSLDDIERAVQAVAISPVSRANIRNVMMNLERKGAVQRLDKGVFLLPKNGEGPASTGPSGATESDEL